MAKKIASKTASPAKPQAKKAASKKPAKAVKSPSHPSFSLSESETIYPSDAVVLGCIRAQAGSAIITPNATLGGLGVNGTILAGCINSQLGTKFKGSNFPSSMTVAQCVYYVRQKVS